MPLACLCGCPNWEPQREGRGEGRPVLGRGFSPSYRSLWGAWSLLPSGGQSHESVAHAADSPERHTGEQNSVGPVCCTSRRARWPGRAAELAARLAWPGETSGAGALRLGRELPCRWGGSRNSERRSRVSRTWGSWCSQAPATVGAGRRRHGLVEPDGERMGRGVAASPRAARRWCGAATCSCAHSNGGGRSRHKLARWKGRSFLLVSEVKWLGWPERPWALSVGWARAPQPAAVRGSQARPPHAQTIRVQLGSTKCPGGRQGTRLLVLEMGPRWKRQRVLRTVLAGGGCRWGASPCSSSSMATGPHAGLSRGRWRSLWTLPVGTQPQSRSHARRQSSMCTSPCCLPPSQGSGLLQRGAARCARPGAPAYVCCTCNSCLIRMANKLQKQLICAAAHTPRSCGSAVWLAAVPPCVPSQWSEHSRSVPPSAQVLKFWSGRSIAPGNCCSGFDKMITIALLKPLK